MVLEYRGIKIAKGGSYLIDKITDSAQVKRNETNYIDTDGSTFSDVFFSPRILTVTGHIIAGNEAELIRLRQNLLKAFNPKENGEVYYFNKKEHYSAPAIPDQLPEFGNIIRGSRIALPFTVYLNLQGFYWLSDGDVVTNIFRRVHKITDTFTLPMVFTERTNNTVVINDGDVPLPLIFTVHCNVGGQNITITNKTTQKHIKLNYTLNAGEKIFIDTENAEVTSSINGNIIKNMANTSEFFTLIPGGNDIESSTQADVVVTSTHRVRYVGV